jgi:uncharacterized protein
MTAGPRVAALYVHPVKSLGGVSVPSFEVGAFGPVGDRRWMLVDDDGVFMTQRTDARLALLRPALDGEFPGAFALHAPGLDPVRIAAPPADAPRRRVQVWNDVVEGAAYPDEVDEWLTEALRRVCHLVHMPDDVWRQVDPTYAGPRDRTSFTDAFPLLVLSRESVADLNERLAAKGVAPVDERRFRPNVVVEGTGRPFAEDDWGDVRLGSAALRVVKPCARCVVTTIDPDSAEPSPRGEPLRTMAEYRTRDGKTNFAQNALVRAAGRVAVGDAVIVPG